MESRGEGRTETESRTDKNAEPTGTTNGMNATSIFTFTTSDAEASRSTSATDTTLAASSGDQTEDKETGGHSIVMATTDGHSAGNEEVEEERRNETSAADGEGDDQEVFDFQPAGGEEFGASESERKSSTSSKPRPAPPSSLSLSGPRPTKKKVLAAPELSLSLGGSESVASDDFPAGFLSPSPDDAEDIGLDLDLDAMETPSDSESLHFPVYDLDIEDDLRRLGVASYHHTASGSRSRSDSRTACLRGVDQSGLGALDKEDVVDSEGTRWRRFSTGDPPQESRVNMSVLEPFLRVLSHGGYYGDGMNDIIVFSSCYLPENTVENYQYVMDNLFRFVIGTLELMVAENYVIVYLCAGGQKEKLPGINWLKDCYTTIDRRLRKNLKGFFVVHPTWYIKVLITIIKPFISSKFSRKLQFVASLQELSHLIPTEHVQIPDCVRQYDQNQTR
ncbi:bcl-2/adenovirus E1B 19 kDa-interacting protein 2-like protein isoform X2 [Kryptolebias marmoratus]|uniref:bcl-2/adenovirus E1B 19 kDa-interacting protein 2-like protein isoform X2 n=1 Tax=Kryptolebias marmoratus TaxID=37003 RepID=UPI0007F8AC42|nr:bcl-2/adenovirus E1B 19 kDa-interacting protein 2-like protein isoform X2 [Kryptolebias marmoratus]